MSLELIENPVGLLIRCRKFPSCGWWPGLIWQSEGGPVYPPAFYSVWQLLDANGKQVASVLCRNGIAMPATDTPEGFGPGLHVQLGDEAEHLDRLRLNTPDKQ